MNCAPSPIGGSFRDPASRVYELDGRIMRGVNEASLENFSLLEATDFYREACAKRAIVETRRLIGDEAAALAAQGWAGVLEHQRLPLISYPYEWTFSMLKDAALLHLDLLEQAIRSGWIIKDSTPYNIQFVGSKPVFIDLPSFVPRKQGQHWAGYRQFCMLFLYPLMLKAHLDIDFNNVLRASLDGVTPQEAARYFGGLNMLKRGVPFHVMFPAYMERRIESKEWAQGPAHAGKARQSDAMVLGLVQSMRRLIESLKTRRPRGGWADYATSHSYDPKAFDEKVRFVQDAAGGSRWNIVWDLGCNTGTFSRLCANTASHVVAVDGDHDAVEALYLAERGTPSDGILPLFMNLANVSPNQGWAGTERLALDRRNRPDLVLCLALIHHMRLSANIPIPLFLDWLRLLEAKIIIEFVNRDDEMVQRLIAYKEEKYPDYNLPAFENELAKRFRVLTRRTLKDGNREIFFCEPSGRY